METDLGLNNGWIERNGKVSAIDKGERAGIYKASLGPDKTWEFNFERRGNNYGEVSWGQKGKWKEVLLWIDGNALESERSGGYTTL